MAFLARQGDGHVPVAEHMQTCAECQAALEWVRERPGRDSTKYLPELDDIRAWSKAHPAPEHIVAKINAILRSAAERQAAQHDHGKP